MTKRSHGAGSFKEDKKVGKTRIRYYVDGKRFSETFTGTKREAEVDCERCSVLPTKANTSHPTSRP